MRLPLAADRRALLCSGELGMVPKTDEPVTPALDVEAEPPIKKACTKQPEGVCVCACVSARARSCFRTAVLLAPFAASQFGPGTRWLRFVIPFVLCSAFVARARVCGGRG